MFLIGMRINRWWKPWRWLRTALAMPRMLRELTEHPEFQPRERLREHAPVRARQGRGPARGGETSGLRRRTSISRHRRGPWRNIDAVELATLEWVDCFNNRRLLEPLGYLARPLRRKAHFPGSMAVHDSESM